LLFGVEIHIKTPSQLSDEFHRHRGGLTAAQA
jgi:hypothetical protein